LRKLSTPNIYSMAKVCSSLKYLSKGSMAISKKKKKEEKGREKKKKKRLVSPLVEKVREKKMMAMPPIRKEDAMKRVNSTHATHMHSLGLGL
jgi:hypothetical protein